MDTFTLLIADSNTDFCKALTNTLQGSYRIFCCHTGNEALQLLEAVQPDLMVLELTLPELDGISLLHRAVGSGLCPKVLATTPYINDYISESTEALGVEYIIQKPCDVRATADRLQDLSRRIHRSDDCAPDPRTHVSNMLIALGVPTKLHGYVYLREAVLLKADSPLQSITKELYPSVAKICGNTAAHVERSIRTAITTAWENRDEQVWYNYFPPDTGAVLRKPTNGHFISGLADRVQLDQLHFFNF